jgi:transcriptional regulator with XRE-family HTH domain
MNLPLQIRSLRLTASLTQADLASRSGIAQPNLAAFESGARRPNLWSLDRLSMALGVEPGRLLQDKAPLSLDRFALDASARALMAGKPGPAQLPKPLWRDLQAVYFSKLSDLAPKVKRSRPRLSPYAAERRAKAWLGREAFGELTRRFEKVYPEQSL